MPINLNETLLTVEEAARRLRVSTATVRNYYSKGYHGLKLESFFVGLRRMTSVEALDRFVAAMNAPRVPLGTEASYRRAERAARRAHQQAMKELKRMGLGV